MWKIFGGSGGETENRQQKSQQMTLAGMRDKQVR
jgi:hypothetical protein